MSETTGPDPNSESNPWEGDEILKKPILLNNVGKKSSKFDTNDKILRKEPLQLNTDDKTLRTEDLTKHLQKIIDDLQTHLMATPSITDKDILRLTKVYVKNYFNSQTSNYFNSQTSEPATIPPIDIARKGLDILQLQKLILEDVLDEFKIHLENLEKELPTHSKRGSLPKGFKHSVKDQ